MYSLLWIAIGAGIGWLTGRSLEGEGHGTSFDVVMGIGGALLGGIAMRSLGFVGFAGTTFVMLVAISCAALMTMLAALSDGRRIYTRAL